MGVLRKENKKAVERNNSKHSKHFPQIKNTICQIEWVHWVPKKMGQHWSKPNALSEDLGQRGDSKTFQRKEHRFYTHDQKQKGSKHLKSNTKRQQNNAFIILCKIYFLSRLFSIKTVGRIKMILVDMQSFKKITSFQKVLEACISLIEESLQRISETKTLSNRKANTAMG